MPVSINEQIPVSQSCRTYRAMVFVEDSQIKPPNKRSVVSRRKRLKGCPATWKDVAYEKDGFPSLSDGGNSNLIRLKRVAVGSPSILKE